LSVDFDGGGFVAAPVRHFALLLVELTTTAVIPVNAIEEEGDHRIQFGKRAPSIHVYGLGEKLVAGAGV